MMGYWVAFAKSGNPNAEGLPAWPNYRPDAEQVMLFDKDMKAGPLPNRPQLDFFKGR
jgi:para-nitrobenzyl esterase